MVKAFKCGIDPKKYDMKSSSRIPHTTFNERFILSAKKYWYIYQH